MDLVVGDWGSGKFIPLLHYSSPCPPPELSTKFCVLVNFSGELVFPEL